MRRILMIYERFPPFNTSGSARPFQFAKHLPKFGYLPTVLAQVPPPDQLGNREILAELDPRVEVLRAEPAVRPRLNPWVQRLSERKRRRQARSGQRAASPPVTSAGLPAVRESSPLPLSTRMSGFVLWSLDWYGDWGWPALQLARRAAREHQFELVWATAPHSRNAVAGYAVSRLLRLPLVLDLRDPWTYGSNWRPRLPSTGRVETWWAHSILGHARRVVFNSPLTEREMSRRFPKAHTSTITNGFDRRDVVPLRDAPLDKCLLRYTGVLNERRVPDPLLAALAKAAHDPEFARDVRLEFVGGMAGHESKLQQYGVEQLVSYRSHVPKLLAERLIRGSDVNVLLQTITTGEDVIAGKLYDYLAAKRPILAVVAKDGGDAWLLNQLGLGEVVSFDDVDAITRALIALWRRWRTGELANPTSPDVGRFDYEHLTGELAAVFDEVLGKPRA